MFDEAFPIVGPPASAVYRPKITVSIYWNMKLILKAARKGASMVPFVVEKHLGSTQYTQEITIEIRPNRRKENGAMMVTAKAFRVT